MDKLSCNIVLDSSNRELNLNGSSSLPVSIYNDNLTLEPVPHHWHEELELIVVTSGEMEVVVELEKIILKKDEGIFINSSRLHSCTNYNNTQCDIKSFVFHSKFIYGDEGSVLYQSYFHNLISQTSSNFQLLSKDECKFILSAYNEFTQENFGYEFKVRNLLCDVLISVIQKTKESETIINSKRFKQLLRCKKMMSFIHDNYQNEITLTQIAHSANIKESESLRCFKAALSTSPIKYLKNYRLEKAAFLLKTTSAPIIDISLSCGFFEISYFSKSFKEVYKSTPTEYRKQFFISK